MATVTSNLTRKPLFIQAAAGDSPTTFGLQYDGSLMRLLVGAIWPRTGILSTEAFKISQRAAGANFSVDIAGGFAILGNTTGSDSERYLIYQQSTVNIPLTGFNTSPAATRTHKVFLAIRDKQKMSAGTLYEGQITITEDTGSGAPDPSGSDLVTFLQVGSFTIGSGQSSVQTAHITNAIRHANYGGSHLLIPITANIVDAAATLAIGSPRAIRMGTTVFLQGGFRRSSLNDFVAGQTYILGTLPTGWRPVDDRYLVGAAAATGANHATYRLTVRAASGNLEALIGDDYSPNWLGIDGLTFGID